MPKRIPHPVHHNNLDVTLDALSCLPDEALCAWGKTYDWAQPVECRVLVNGEVSSVKPVSSLEVLLRRGDARLNTLLLRPDMFALGSCYNDGAYARALYDNDEDKYHNLTSENSLLHEGLRYALSISDIESAAVLDHGLRGPEGFDMVRWFYVNMTGAKEKEALLANGQPLGALEKAIAFCEEKVVEDACRFRQGLRPTKAVFRQEHLWRWRHGMCVAALRLDHPVLFERMHAAIGNACTKSLVNACVEHGQWDRLLGLCQAARASGWADEGQWPVQLGSNAPVGMATAEAAVQAAVNRNDPQWKQVSLWALSGDLDAPGEVDMSDYLIPVALSGRASDMDASLWQKMVDRFPVASMLEMGNLLAAHGCQDRWDQRVSTLAGLDRSTLAKQLSAWSQGKELHQWKSGPWEDRLGQLLALAPDAWSTVSMRLGRYREKVADHMRSFQQQQKLESQTLSPIALRPRRSL